MIKIGFVLFAILSGTAEFAFASESLGMADADLTKVDERSTDIVERTINFLIFASILYYLLAEPVKGFFKGRSQLIADELNKVQHKLKESAELKEKAQQKVKDAEKFAADLHESAKKENEIIVQNINTQCDMEIGNLVKHNESLMELESRKMIREVVDEIMRDVLEQDSSFDKESMANIIMKKVA